MRFFFPSIALFLSLFHDKSLSLPVSCDSLVNYVNAGSQENLETFLGGGDIPADVPVFLTIPRTEIDAPNSQYKLCLEDILIPTSVGGNECNETSQCWLAIGIHTGNNLDPEDIQYCKSSDPYTGAGPCFNCVCQGSDMGAGSVPPNRTLSDGCGVSAQDDWGVSCTDAMNGRMNDASKMTLSNYSTVQVNICPETGDDCGVCEGGGYQAQFLVGLTWINNVEQCFKAFPSSGTTKTVVWLTAMSAITACISLLFM
eukprot:CAMPEP_0197434320 /NCGR_PEP_ID=MMETSP1175-20131217/2071_1 /TAXON_ID=1003142 /ORGANISM="Triceratium dubium, Strain CCMP147" /LENGTH=255 /DNA_ID=CAMNT_0042962997 /DNA_START=210 /DNA_END=977 /DNA_ORIENTATION=-